MYYRNYIVQFVVQNVRTVVEKCETYYQGPTQDFSEGGYMPCQMYMYDNLQCHMYICWVQSMDLRNPWIALRKAWIHTLCSAIHGLRYVYAIPGFRKLPVVFVWAVVYPRNDFCHVASTTESKSWSTERRSTNSF